MTRYFTVAIGVAFLAADVTWGQVGSVSPYNRPNVNPRATVSPMIRLRDGGGAITYFGQIRPQMQNTRSIQQLQGDFLNFEQQQQGGAYGLPQDQIILPTTGHPVRYFDYSYFFRMGGGVAGQPFTGGNAGGNFGGNFNNTGGVTSRGVTGIIR